MTDGIKATRERLQRLRFRRFGGEHHLVLENADQLRRIADLDEAHWVAVSAPCATLDIDPAFLRLVDLDQDGRIRPFEVRLAVDWLLARLTDTSGLAAACTTLTLTSIETESDEGKELLATAHQVLDLLKITGDVITLEQVREVLRLEEKEPVSEAGVVLPHATGDEATWKLIHDVVTALGGVPHPAGAKGVDTKTLDRFVDEATRFTKWYESGLLESETPDSRVMPYGSDTQALYEALLAVSDKIDQYFAQCRALTLDLPVDTPVGLMPDLNDPASIDGALEAAPLAPASADRLFDLGAPVNIAWGGRVTAFVEGPMQRVLGAVDELGEADWKTIQVAFKAHAEWSAARPEVSASKLGYDVLVMHLDEAGLARVRALIEKSSATALTLGRIRQVEKLVLFQAHLLQLANNYVSFPDLYLDGRRAAFDVGNLVMDGRHFNLAVRVTDRKEHVALASKSNLCVLYVQTSGEKVTPYEVAVPVTAGGLGNLCVGKRGMFIDTSGRELDARVVHMVHNPISFREAVAAPFRRLEQALTNRLESVTESAATDLEAAGGSAVSTVAAGTKGALATAPKPAATTAPTATAAPSQKGGVLAGGGIALAALGSSVVYILDTLRQMTWLNIATGIVAALLAVMIPATLLALVKLHRRDLSSILEGSGWAINIRMGLTRRQARSFTLTPKYPATARGVYPPWRRGVKKRVPPPLSGEPSSE